MKKLTLPLREEDIKRLKAGDSVLLTGSMLTGRDAAHKRLYELIEQGKELPVDIQGETIYYVGPAPAKPGHAVGPAGPTSSYRMDKYAPALLDRGLKAMVGKGARSKEVIDAIVRNGGVYFAAIGGAAALIAKASKARSFYATRIWGRKQSGAMWSRTSPALSSSTAKAAISTRRSRPFITGKQRNKQAQTGFALLRPFVLLICIQNGRCRTRRAERTTRC